ncbi:MAG: AAA family ATPase [Ignavibacteriaceae bacterium]|jgi:SpoVK/Ycf46/Vps4 family AAA+-type ATPase|nr:AAA family ATPase [Ignavibacteriaceae bacterium]
MNKTNGNSSKPNELFTAGVMSSELLVCNSVMQIGLQEKNPNGMQLIEAKSVRMFNLEESLNSQKKTYLLQFDESITTYIAAEIVIKNPYFKSEDRLLRALTIWYFEDEEIGRNDFNLSLNKYWELVEFVQSWGTPVPGFWKCGEVRIEIFLENQKILKHNFLIGNQEIINFVDNNVHSENHSDKQNTRQPKKLEQLQRTNSSNNSIKNLFDEFDNLVGLQNLKQSLKDFISYLEFVKERKAKGIETNENISANCIFLGNPGTGKTTVARILGRFFKAIGLLENGHVVEVDRASLIGEYIGETAQKTEKVINQALGGILFIDEAYSLKRDKSPQDFGQEAIDIILKRMEDYKDKFFVIAAGYPEPMEKFINSNPGLKSRFTHHFYFDDYNSNELAEIFRIFSEKEKYAFNEKAEKFLLGKLNPLIDNTDVFFGNARFIRNLFSEAKIELSKRYHLLEDEEKNFTNLNTILVNDIQSAWQNIHNRNSANTKSNDKLERYINEINNLVALDSVKLIFNKIVSSIKVDRLKSERSISSIHRIYNSIFISAPGSGTSTVARLFAKSLYASNKLSKGQLIEIDESAFSGLSKIEAYLSIDEIFKQLKGSIVLINDVTASLQCEKNFSNSLLQYFLKKLYLSGDDIVAILAGTKSEINFLVENFPVLESQFPNIFEFEPYTNRQLLEIALSICQKKNYQLDEGAWQQLLELIDEMRKEQNRNFYNARSIKELLNRAISIQEDRILSMPDIMSGDLMTITLEDLTLLRSMEI